MSLPSFLTKTPTKIICVELNYKSHADKLRIAYPKKPIWFIKPVETLCSHDEPIIIPRNCFSVDHQATLAVIIKNKIHKTPKTEILNHIEGYTCANDVTIREQQAVRAQIYRMKSYPTFTPLGPELVKQGNTHDASKNAFNPDNAEVRCYVNSQLRQKCSTSDFIYPIEELLYLLGQELEIEKGDIILTGTPYGIGILVDGDVVEVEIEGIGRLKNHVIQC